MGNILTNYNDRWTQENPKQDAFYPRLSYGTNANNSQNSTWWLHNMSMLRMKDIEIGYTFPKHWINSVGLANIRLYAKGSNLFGGWELQNKDSKTIRNASPVWRNNTRS